MSQQYRTVTTNAGRNAVREALSQGKTVKLSHMSVGDGGGGPVTPTSSMAALVNERFRAQINDIVLDPDTPDLFTAELFIPQAEGGWYKAHQPELDEIYDKLVKLRDAMGRKLGYDGYTDSYYGRTWRDAPDIDGSVSFTCGYELNEGDFVDVEIFDVNEYDLIGEVI